MTQIYYTKPSITQLEVAYATDAAENGWGAQCYDYIVKFENAFKQWIGSAHAVATSSCTGAMHLGLAALQIGPGDEVIVPDINWIASVAPITYLGATPVFVDVDALSWCLDPTKVEAAITPRTKAIIAVHLYGNTADIAALRKIADRHGLYLIEDAAEALGSAMSGRAAGTIADFGTFSFHGTKTVTTGEGGMFVTNDSALHEKVLTLNNHGRVRGESRQFWSSMIGYKYKISNIQAAIGLAQIERIDELVRRKRQIFQIYEKSLAGLALRLNPEPDDTVNGYWMPTIVVNDDQDFDRDRLIASFKQKNIDARVFFWPVSMLPMFPTAEHNIVSYGLYARGLNLPSYHDMSNSDIEFVSEIVRKSLAAQ